MQPPRCLIGQCLLTWGLEGWCMINTVLHKKASLVSNKLPCFVSSYINITVLDHTQQGLARTDSVIYLDGAGQLAITQKNTKLRQHQTEVLYKCTQVSGGGAQCGSDCLYHFERSCADHQSLKLVLLPNLNCVIKKSEVSNNVPKIRGCMDYQKQVFVLYQCIFLCYRVNQVWGNVIQIISMTFCPSTSSLKIPIFALQVKTSKCSE